MSGKLYIDCETYSPVPIARGVYAYAEPAEVMIVTWAMDDEAPRAWDCTAQPDKPPELLRALATYRVAIAHNASFDRHMLRGIVSNNPHDWRCTRAQAYSHSLPGELDLLCEVLRVEGKRSEGKALIQLFCKPTLDGKRNTRLTHPKEWATFMEYARQDINALRAVERALPTWNYPYVGEHAVWALDQKINDRGFLIDVALARAAETAAAKGKARTSEATRAATLGLVGSATQRESMLAHLNSVYDTDLPDLRADTIDTALATDLPEGARELLVLRREAARVSVAKYSTALRSMSADGYLRGTITYCGASRTGRWSGSKFNALNMARPGLPPKEIDDGITALKAGALELVSDQPWLLLSSAVRGLLVAAPGKKLVVSDLSNIEGRVLAWIADEHWKLRAFAASDMGVGEDLYKLQYARQFGIAPAEVGKDERQIGKVEELGLGFQGGVGAFVTFAATYGLDLDRLAKDAAPIIPRDLWDEAQGEWDWAKREGRTYGLPVLVYMTCSALKRMWRESNPAIAQLWPAAENAARDVMCGGNPVVLGKLTFDRVRNWLRIKLPSGRYLCYPGTRVNEKGKLSYLGLNTYSKQWGRIGTYGGKIVENCTQAIARDIFARGMLRAEAAGYAVVLPVHDEVVAETPDTGQYTAGGLSDILAAGEQWTAGLPLAAHGFEAYRYGKRD